MNNSKEKFLPAEIFDFIEKYDENDISIYIRKAEVVMNSISVELELRAIPFLSEEIINQYWRIHINEYKTGKILFDVADNIQLVNRHPLLWEFNDLHCSLYFNDKSEKLVQLFHELYAIHYSIFEDYIPFEKYLNTAMDLYSLLKSGNGFLANGPIQYIQDLSSCLTKNEISHSIINEKESKWWNGNQYEHQMKDLKVFLIGGAYIIGKDFTFTQIKLES